MNSSIEGDAVVRIFLDDEVVDGRIFDDPRIGHFGAAASRLRSCEFRRLRITQGSFGAGYGVSLYENCIFEACNIRLMIPGRATFIGCHFKDVRLFGWVCHEVEFVDCVFSGKLSRMIFEASLLQKVRMSLGREKNRYENNDFRNCRFQDVSFRGGIRLAPELMPTEPGGVFVPAASVLRDALADLRQLDAVKGIDFAISRLETSLIYADKGQDQFYYSPADLSPKNPEKAAGYAILRDVLERRLRGTSA